MNGKGRLLVGYYATGLVLLFTALFVYLSDPSLPVSFRTTKAANPSDHPTSSQLILWLQSRGLTPGSTLFVSIGDASYLSALHNFRQRLDQWGHGKNLVVMCLDRDCRDYDAFHGYPGFIGRSIAYIKFAVNLDLAQHGYNFIGFDGDVYLTGMHDPFANMLPLSNDTRDIQFQPDGHYRELNFGWFFAKATTPTIELFRRSFATWKNNTGLWDQKVVEDMANKMEFDEHSLQVHRLHETQYKNFMLHESWEDKLFGAEDSAQAFVNESTLLHYTCIESNLKEYFGRNFGGFGDVQQYYSNPPALLGTANIFGLVASIHAQVIFAAQLAASTDRTFIWPDAVNMVQKRFSESANLTTLSHRPRFPGIRAVSYASAKGAGVEAVEGRYLSNQFRYTTDRTSLEQVVLNVTQYVFGDGISALETRIWELLPHQVAILDFANFGPSFLEMEDVQADGPHDLGIRYSVGAVESTEARWFQDNFETPGVSDYTSALSSRIKKCQKANWDRGCLAICD